ncbi:MAG: MarR family transcriptional regulator [Marmoricola sp.]|nr:MarR family transcriptional regulator [Marmoricola sp.]
MVDDETMRALEHEMGVLVRRLRRKIAERARLVHPDLSPVAYSMLIALHDGGPRRASDLVDMFSIDKGAVSRQVQSLLELGLIERTPDPEDRRTEVRERLGDWTDDDLAQLVGSMARYNQALDLP